MDPNDLKTPELCFELRSRGVEPKSNQQLRRTQLRGVLAQEHEGIKFPYVKYFSFDENVSEIEVTLNELLDMLSTDRLLTDLEIRRVESRLTHVRRRCSLLQPENEVQKSKVSVFESQILLITGFLIEQKINGSPTPIASSTLQSNEAQTSSVLVPCTKPVSISKWNIKFSGHSDKESVMSFLEKIDDFCVARQVSEQQLFTSAVDLFSGPALLWYRNVKTQVKSWPELVTCLKRDFLPVDYEDDLLAEIRARTQGPDENVLFYIIAVEALFGRLTSPPPEREIIKQVRRNLNPFFAEKLALTETPSLNDLKDKCRALQEIKIRNERYHPPPSKKKTLLEPDLAYLSLHDFKNSGGPSTSKIHKEMISSILCWNCDSSGHSFRACSAPKKIFCHKCGSKGNYSSSCPDCQSKNVTAGIVHSPASFQNPARPNRSMPSNQRAHTQIPFPPASSQTTQFVLSNPPPRVAKFVPPENKSNTNHSNKESLK